MEALSKRISPEFGALEAIHGVRACCTPVRTRWKTVKKRVQPLLGGKAAYLRNSIA
jgi:hypothetical protein